NIQQWTENEDQVSVWLLISICVAHYLVDATPTPPTTTKKAGLGGSCKGSADCLPPTPTPPPHCPGLEITWPEDDVGLNGRVSLSCSGCSKFPQFSTLYWMGNGSFIEHLPGRLREGELSRQPDNQNTRLSRSLVLEELSPALRSTNFSCVYVDPGQVVQKHVVLARVAMFVQSEVPQTRMTVPRSISLQWRDVCPGMEGDEMCPAV
uniref:Ig-like domain-containing protein n=1 Tax=Sciurus vulgaris TaxID=55149 RepID=A0A8D2CY91_SCIVU